MVVGEDVSTLSDSIVVSKWVLAAVVPVLWNLDMDFIVDKGAPFPGRVGVMVSLLPVAAI